MHPAVDAPVCPNPRRQARQAAAPVRGVGEMALDFAAVVKQLFPELRIRILEQLDRAQSARGLLVLTDAALASITSAGHQLQLIPSAAGLVQRVRIIIGVADEVTLDGRCPHQPLRHDALILVHRGDTPSRDGALGIDNSMDFVALGLAIGGPTIASLAVFGATTDS